MDQAPVDRKEICQSNQFLHDFRVIWQIEGDPAIKMGNHIRIMGFLPQVELLGRPQIKVFVSHDGLKSEVNGLKSEKRCM